MIESENRKSFIYLKEFLYRYFSLQDDKIDEEIIIANITKNSSIKGSNLWALIFAIFIASVGLNINSTAVIIGAMLISPLMGPIMGIGMSIGIFDFQLLKSALRNLFMATVVSITTSALYFWISPISQAQSELLARTNPTIYDVIIAFFGGMAGIVAGSRNKKGGVLAGVAIATALMPPLCTAGFGIATGNYYFTLRALYLYIINSVFIGLGTLLFVRYSRFPVRQYLESQHKKLIKAEVIMIMLVVFVPSIFQAYRLVLANNYQSKANQFIKENIIFQGTSIINKHIIYSHTNPMIKLVLFGDKVDSSKIDSIRLRLSDYNLGNTTLEIVQGDDLKKEVGLLNNEQNSKINILENLISSSSQKIKKLETNIINLKSDFSKQHKIQSDQIGLREEIAYHFPHVTEYALYKQKTIKIDTSFIQQDTTLFFAVKTKKNIKKDQIVKMEKWLSVRLKTKQIKVVNYN